MNGATFAGKLFERLKISDIDEDFLTSYRKLLFGQYATLANVVNNPAAKAEADRILKMNPEEVDWEELYQLELAIIKLEPEESLRSRIWILRNEYKEVASPDEYKDYIESKPPDAKTGAEASLRADAVRLQEEMNWRYVIIWVFESFRGHIIKSLARATTVLLIITLLLICFWEKLSSSWLATTNTNFLLLALIAVPGILGGLISTLRRLQKAKLGSSSNADVDLTELQQGKLGIYLSPLLGGIFALLLFFLFAGGFVTGTLFPSVTFDNLFLGKTASLNYLELSKLVIWSFISGFAEKFVPDKLERFSQGDGDKAPPEKK